MKATAVLISGMLAGLGGAFLVDYTGIYHEGQTGGRGYIGLAAMIFGNWRPGGLLAGSALFGYTDSLQQQTSPQTVHALLLLAAILLLVLTAAWLFYQVDGARRAIVSSCRRRARAGSGTSSPTPSRRSSPRTRRRSSRCSCLAVASQRLRTACGRRHPWRRGQGPDRSSMVRTTTIDLASSDVVANPYPFFAAERAVAPVQWHDGLGMWLTFSHAAANSVLRHRGLGRVWAPRWPNEPMPAFDLIHVNSLLESEPPKHTRLRRLIAAAFGRGHVERLRPRVAQLATVLADRVADAGSDGSKVDLIAEFAEPLPVQVIAELLGVPEVDWHLLRPWSNAIVKMYEYDVTTEQRAEAEQASADFVAYLRSLVAERRVKPSDDLLSSMLAETDSDGARLSEDELITTCTLVLNAGHEATVNVVGNGVTALLHDRDQFAALARRLRVVDSAVEELIRYDSPLQLFERTAAEDVQIEDVTVRAGQKIAALLGAANRDPDVFDEPNRFDVTRADNPHLGFGAGIHFCVGAPLARVELQTSLATLRSRFPRLVLAAEPERRPEFVIRGVTSLPVTLN